MISQLHEWTTAVCTNLMYASKHTDSKEIEWFKESEAKTLDELVDSGEARFKQIDLILAQKLLVTLPPELKERARAAGEKQMREKQRPLNGRQVACLIYESFRTDPHLQVRFGWEDLANVLWEGDTPAAIERFLEKVARVIRGLPPGFVVNDEMKADMYHTEMRNSNIDTVKTACERCVC